MSCSTTPRRRSTRLSCSTLLPRRRTCSPICGTTRTPLKGARRQRPTTEDGSNGVERASSKFALRGEWNPSREPLLACGALGLGWWGADNLWWPTQDSLEGGRSHPGRRGREGDRPAKGEGVRFPPSRSSSSCQASNSLGLPPTTSFLEKYWMYIVPVLLVMLFTGGEEEGAK